MNQYKAGDIVLGNWKLNRLLGEGSFGRVFEAVREDFGVIYRAAVKIISIPQNQAEVASARAEGMDDDSVTAYFRGLVEEIVREFALMSELKGTANIVSYEDHAVVKHDVGIGWDIFIRMELLTPLFQHTNEQTFTRHDAIKLGIDMCRALELCQKFNIVHRDIKPENIFVSKLGDYKLGDFGIARTVEKTTSGLSKKGTYTYMAPEIYRGESYGSSVDIYSLGIVMFRLLNDNRAPFLPDYPTPITHHEREAALAKRISGAVLPQPRNADGRLSEIVLKACSYNPKERYSSPVLMRQELDAILYNREQASIIYPNGDEAPIKPLEYMDESNTPIASELIEDDKTESFFGKSIKSDFTESVLESILDDEEIYFENPVIEANAQHLFNDGDNLDSEWEDPQFIGSSVYYNGDYVLLGKYNETPIKWIVYDCYANYCCLLSDDFLYASQYNGDWENSKIRNELNGKLFFEFFTSEQQKGFLPIDGDLLTIASEHEYLIMKENIEKKQLKCSYDSWLKEKKHYISTFGFMDVLEFQNTDLTFGVRPICKINISVLEIIAGSGHAKDPYELDSKMSAHET